MKKLILLSLAAALFLNVMRIEINKRACGKEAGTISRKVQKNTCYISARYSEYECEIDVEGNMDCGWEYWEEDITDRFTVTYEIDRYGSRVAEVFGDTISRFKSCTPPLYADYNKNHYRVDTFNVNRYNVILDNGKSFTEYLVSKEEYERLSIGDSVTFGFFGSLEL